MALSIRNPEAERLARSLSKATGLSLTQVIIEALKDKSLKLRHAPARNGRVERIMEISRRCASLPTLDSRTEDEILGYDSNGIPN